MHSISLTDLEKDFGIAASSWLLFRRFGILRTNFSVETEEAKWLMKEERLVNELHDQICNWTDTIDEIIVYKFE